MNRFTFSIIIPDSTRKVDLIHFKLTDSGRISTEDLEYTEHKRVISDTHFNECLSQRNYLLKRIQMWEDEYSETFHGSLESECSNFELSTH